MSPRRQPVRCFLPMSDGLPGFFEGTEMPTAGWWETLWPDPTGVLAAVGIQPETEAVDLCCGDGWFTLPMAKIARRVVAIDIDRHFLGLAQQRLSLAGTTNCDFVEGDAYDLDRLVPRHVDFVFMANAFHGVPEPLRLARAAGRTLKPKGRFAIVNWHKRPREQTPILGEPRGPRTELRMSPEQTIRSVGAGELQFANLVELPPYHYAVIFQRTPS